jgi:hypothetical protein
MGLKYAIHRVDGNAAELYAYAEQKGFSVARIGRPVGRNLREVWIHRRV